MLGTGPRLYFPKLRFVAEAAIHGSKKKKPLYRLDWSKLEAHRREHFDQWRKSCWPDREDLHFVPGLPIAYESLVKDAVFALDSRYEAEIIRNCHRAVQEWGLTRYFDTMIREMCLEPAEAHARVAVELIGDCIINPDSQGYASWARKKIFVSATLWKLWYKQTGRGLLYDRAQLDNLKRLIGYPAGRALGCIEEDDRQQLRAYLDAMKMHDEKIDESVRLPMSDETDEEEVSHKRMEKKNKSK